MVPLPVQPRAQKAHMVSAFIFLQITFHRFTIYQYAISSIYILNRSTLSAATGPKMHTVSFTTFLQITFYHFIIYQYGISSKISWTVQLLQCNYGLKSTYGKCFYISSNNISPFYNLPIWHFIHVYPEQFISTYIAISQKGHTVNASPA